MNLSYNFLQDGKSMTRHTIERRYRALSPAMQERVKVMAFGIFIATASLISISLDVDAAATVGQISASIVGVEMSYVISEMLGRRSGHSS